MFPNQAPAKETSELTKDTPDNVEKEHDVVSRADDYEDPIGDDEELKQALMSILENFDRVEESNRAQMVRVWQKCENYWHHLQNMYWSTDSNDYRTPEYFLSQNPQWSNYSDVEMKIVNIYRAHGESIVAALSINTPSVNFFPENADDSEDLLTSEACSKIAKMIERQNKAKLLLMRMIYVLFNQGLCAVHNFSHESEDYGTKTVQIKDTKTVHETDLHCPSCGEFLNKLGPSPEPIKYDSKETMVCPECEAEGIPIPFPGEQEVEYTKGEQEVPKVRQRINIYGPLNVKVSSYAYDAKSVGILVLDVEQDRAKAQEMYPDVADKFISGPLNSEVSTQARRPANVFESWQAQNVTVRRVWVRPWYFNSFTKTGNPKEDEIVKKLKSKFPHGVCFHAVNRTYCESYTENIDTAWSLSFNPLSRFLHADPIGQTLLPIQDMTNEMVNLELQSIEYGVPEKFVDPSVLDLDEYRQAKGGPGMVFPVKPAIPGQEISKSFFESRTATLTDEAGEFRSRLDSDGQFVSGDYPSIYGGPNSGDTAAEYSMSRQQALQRLSITWTIVNFLWADVMKNAVQGYIANLKEDEFYVEKGAAAGQFINIWIKMDELAGNIGDVYPEASEQFPLSWAQKREVMMQLITAGNPMLESVIADPNNRSFVADLIGLSELSIPGDKDRKKQLAEISEMLRADPIDMQTSSVQIEPAVDDDMMHIEICKHWANSEIGMYFKKSNPGRYMNVILHMEAHQMNMMQQTIQQGNNPPGVPEPSNSSEAM